MSERERVAEELTLNDRISISAVLIAHGVWTDPDDWHTDEDREDLLVALIGAALLREQDREPDVLLTDPRSAYMNLLARWDETWERLIDEEEEYASGLKTAADQLRYLLNFDAAPPEPESEET